MDALVLQTTWSDPSGSLFQHRWSRSTYCSRLCRSADFCCNEFARPISPSGTRPKHNCMLSGQHLNQDTDSIGNTMYWSHHTQQSYIKQDHIWGPHLVMPWIICNVAWPIWDSVIFFFKSHWDQKTQGVSFYPTLTQWETLVSCPEHLNHPRVMADGTRWCPFWIMLDLQMAWSPK